MHGYYKLRIATKTGQTRKETVLDYISTTTWNTAEYMGEKETTELYTNIGIWAMNITKNMTKNSFDVIVIFDNDNVKEFWYVDAKGTIKKVFEY